MFRCGLHRLLIITLMLMGVGADKTQVIKGLVLLLAVTFDVYNKRAGKESIIDKLFGKKNK